MWHNETKVRGKSLNSSYYKLPSLTAGVAVYPYVSNVSHISMLSSIIKTRAADMGALQQMLWYNASSDKITGCQIRVENDETARCSHDYSRHNFSAINLKACLVCTFLRPSQRPQQHGIWSAALGRGQSRLSECWSSGEYSACNSLEWEPATLWLSYRDVDITAVVSWYVQHSALSTCLSEISTIADCK